MDESKPEGWYPNPSDETQMRYWDGANWTDNVAVPDKGKKPYYKRPWFIVLAVVVAISVFGSNNSDDEQAQPVDVSASETPSPSATADPTPTPTPTPTTTPTPSPSPSEDLPESPIIFAAGVNDALGDMEKDLDDLVNAVNNGGVLRVALNVAEVVANLGQLSAHTPPVEIEDEWNEQMLVLETEIYALGELVNQDGSVKELKAQVRVVSKQIETMRKIVAKLG